MKKVLNSFKICPKKIDQDLELTMYHIPDQLEKTFGAEIVFGTRNIYPEPKKEAYRQA